MIPQLVVSDVDGCITDGRDKVVDAGLISAVLPPAPAFAETVVSIEQQDGALPAAASPSPGR